MEVDFTDRVTDIIEERIDVAIRMTATPPESFIAKKLFRDIRVLCASPRYLKEHGTPKTPKDLEQHYGVMFTKGDVPVSWKLFPTKSDMHSRLYQPKARMHLSSIMSVYAAAKAGLGIADMPRYLLEDDFSQRVLVPVLEAYSDSPRYVWAVYSGSRAIPKKIKLFVEMLQTRLTANDR
jgi:DNA-binding transcriptional LysR family regulator